MLKKLQQHWSLILLLTIAIFSHGYNMFHFPYYENDEGVYMSQAWSVIDSLELAPYTYWYDHAPAGWIMISVWLKITGGIFTFGESINSGRVLVLLLHVLSTFFIYYIVQYTTKQKALAFIAGLVFTMSPLGIYFGRRILLDSIMTFWVLLSLLLIVKKDPSLWKFLFSGISFGIAILVKESAIVFAPAFLWLAIYRSSKNTWLFSTTTAVMGSFLIVSLYPLFALLRKEFFEYGSLLGSSYPHVSLIGTLKFQGSRPGGSFFTPYDSAFWSNYIEWFKVDPFLMTSGVAMALLVLVFGFSKRKAQPFIFASGLLSLCYLLFLARGGIVIEFYIIPLIFLYSLNIGLGLYIMSNLIKRFTNSFVLKIFMWAFIISIIIYYSITGWTYLGMNVFTADQTSAQAEALDWIRENASPDDVIIIDNYGWVDLNDPKNRSGLAFKNAEWYWKVEKDPAIREALLEEKISNVAYVLVTPQMRTDSLSFEFIREILYQGEPITSFNGDQWDVEIWGIRTPNNVIDRSWRHIKRNFIESGAVKDIQNNNKITAENQSWALLQAVWLNDQEAFAQIYNWSKRSLQKENGLYAGEFTATKITNATSGTLANQNIALALIFAQKQWNNKTYKDDALNLLKNIKDESVVNINNSYYLSALDTHTNKTEILFNPSYLSPAWYRIFANFDANNTALWNSVVKTSYEVIEGCTFNLQVDLTNKLPPDWCVLNLSSREYSPPTSPNPASITYSSDARRVPLFLAFDYVWFDSLEAKNYLESLTVLPDEWTSRGEISTTYTHEGFPFERRETVSAYAGHMGYFIVHDKNTAEKIYDEKIIKKFYEDRHNSYWEDPRNLSTQNMAWLSTGLYANLLTNIYDKK